MTSLKQWFVECMVIIRQPGMKRVFYSTVGCCITLAVMLLPAAQQKLEAANPLDSIASIQGAIANNRSLESRLTPPVVQEFEELAVPGAIIGVWMKGYLPWVKTLGVSDLEKQTPIRRNDKMRIGSITKTFVGTVLLQLVDEKKVNLDDPVSKYLANIPNGENITIRQIGTMSSGLFNYSTDPAFEEQMSANPSLAWKPKDLLPISALLHD